MADLGPFLEITVDGRAVRVEAGITVAAALWNLQIRGTRRSAAGEPRGPLCGMGICYECRVTIDGVPHRRACLEVCRPGMGIDTVERDPPGRTAGGLD
jgi:predicted molibdopterin-dependent oxidoreductase YjgC